MTVEKTQKEIENPLVLNFLSQLKSSASVSSQGNKAKLTISAKETEGDVVTTYKISLEGRAISGIFAALVDHQNKEAVAMALKGSSRDLALLAAIASSIDEK
ncbi:hypothetical protein [Pusillimonas sp. ANT_WB101]|uniref:hypothetical protein n=1 Tax=Pusillimonas sp. ANT_WB101 TaxID=2597356 RepID=UPI0011EC204F|nr:hypothetical protein [Pusillimonas sp. ANT_WB101]KAA0910644.1 hypothetical protein FQ179_01845 [Pusillimonas sp. ANT_WB101]